MQNESGSLHKLLQMKEDAMQKALSALASVKEQFQHGQNRHAQLSGYKLDYLQQMEDIGKNGGTLGQLKNRADFLSNVDAVILHLNMQMAQTSKQMERLQVAYFKAQEEQKKVIKLIERKQVQEIRLIRRTEQKDIDEYAQKQWYTQRSISKTDGEYTD